MRLFAHHIRRGHVRSGVLAILLALNGSSVSPGSRCRLEAAFEEATQRGARRRHRGCFRMFRRFRH